MRLARSAASRVVELILTYRRGGPGSPLLQLSADFAAWICSAVHVDVQVAGLEARHLRCCELGAAGNLVVVPILSQPHDGWTIRACGAFMDVRSRTDNSSGTDAT